MKFQPSTSNKNWWIKPHHTMENSLLSILLSWATPVTLLALTVTILYLYLTWPYSTWSKLGVPGPKPLPLVGNGREFNAKGFTVMQEWNKKYGANVGIYLGQTPVLLTTDVDIIKQCFCKDVDNFTHRRAVISDLNPSCILQSVAAVNDDVTFWRMRHTLSPLFSASKLKMMDQIVTQCCSNLVKVIGTSSDKKQLLDVKRLFGAFTIDAIAGAGFGIETNTLLNNSTELADNVMAVLNSVQIGTVEVSIAQAFPVLVPIMQRMGFYGISGKETKYVGNIARTVMELKKHNSKPSPDLMQRMMDSEISDQEAANNPDKKGLTTEEIVAMGLIFFVAGYDTTATTLQYLTYLLAKNPDKQEKLYQEIVAAMGDSEPSYETVTKIPYLDSCIHEAGRLFPPVPVIDRAAKEARVIKGITIPPGASVMPNMYALLKDETHFPQAAKFIPERFQDDTRPLPALLKEMMFGAGARQCIGMRLALYEAKMAVVSVLRQFRFVTTKDTVDEITHTPGTFTDVPLKKVMIAAERR